LQFNLYGDDMRRRARMGRRTRANAHKYSQRNQEQEKQVPATVP